MADCAMIHGGMSHAGRLAVNASPLGMINEDKQTKAGIQAHLRSCSTVDRMVGKDGEKNFKIMHPRHAHKQSLVFVKPC